ncbi:hypothetical protein AX16_000766 [Volvariella volvacea WC 439]|nr:hypothetical protein AX16_000766 [Volvariella volvacea WC 439]
MASIQHNTAKVASSSDTHGPSAFTERPETSPATPVHGTSTIAGNGTTPNDHPGGGENPVQTKYEAMLLALDDIPIFHTILAGFFTWILLAGFLLFPGTFTNLQRARATSGSDIERRVLDAIAHVPLFVIAWLCTGIGAAGMIWLWWRWMNNYIWITNKIFIPGFLNGIAGIISTLVNIFGVHQGEFSSAGTVTIIVTSGTAIICGILMSVYNFWLLKGVKREHIWTVGKERAGKHGEGKVDLSKRRTVTSANGGGKGQAASGASSPV